MVNRKCCSNMKDEKNAFSTKEREMCSSNRTKKENDVRFICVLALIDVNKGEKLLLDKVTTTQQIANLFSNLTGSNRFICYLRRTIVNIFSTSKGKMTAVLGREIAQKQSTPVPKPRSYQPRRKCIIPFEIIQNFEAIWLGTYSKETLPSFARDLLKQITFIDTAVDCIEHITLSFISQRPIILIISDEYATNRKVMAHLLDLTGIQTIYIVLDSLQQGSIDWFFNNRRIEPVFNDTLTVLFDLIHDEMENSVHFDEQLHNAQGATKKNTESVRFAQVPSPPSIAERNILFKQTPPPPSVKERSIPSKQTPPPSSRTERNVGHKQTTTPKKAEEPTKYYKGFVTITGVNINYC